MSDKAIEFEDWYEENKMESMLDMSKVTEMGAKMLMQVQAKQAWQAAKEQYAPRWISIEDRSPDEAQVILVKDRIEMIFKATFIRGQFPRFDTHRCVSDVTHWMPAQQLEDKE